MWVQEVTRVYRLCLLLAQGSCDTISLDLRGGCTQALSTIAIWVRMRFELSSAEVFDGDRHYARGM